MCPVYMTRFLVHYGLHFLLPIGIVLLFFKDRRGKVLLLLWAGLLIDLDHLLANPIFDPSRCSINYHPLHTYWAMLAYLVLFLFKNTRIIALGLFIHLLADAADCFLMIDNAY